MLSPGITISVPSGKVTTPVTSDKIREVELRTVVCEEWRCDVHLLQNTYVSYELSVGWSELAIFYQVRSRKC